MYNYYHTYKLFKLKKNQENSKKKCIKINQKLKHMSSIYKHWYAILS